MPLSSTLLGTDAARDIGSLALSLVDGGNPMLELRAAQWRNALVKVGLPVPFWIVHDLGMLTIAEPEGDFQPRPAVGSLNLDGPMRGRVQELLRVYGDTLRELSTSEVLETARQWRLADPLISVLLLKVLGPLFERFDLARSTRAALLPLDPEVYTNLGGQLPGLFNATERSVDIAFLEHVVAARVRLITAVEQIDLDTLRLLGMFGAEASAAGAMEMVDLLNVFESPEANDVVNFSLDLLPSVLETKKASGQQSFAVDGYSGVDRRGTIDSLVLSELAFDNELFERRFAEKEVFYYAHEKQHEEDRRLHYILVDASASMRGQRAVFARGLALTLVKKLQLQGEDVYLRFFDSRLYDVQHARRGRVDGGGISVPYVLCFRGERGRNYAKVFNLLTTDLQRLQRQQRRTPIVYLMTHAQCHIPTETVERLRTFARLYGVFMLPSNGDLELDYLHLLDKVEIVDSAALTQQEARTQRALEIVDDATREEGSEVRAASIAPPSPV
ncbi:MAG: hypothetical protein AB8H86_19285 [Polyangiales bacterium]